MRARWSDWYRDLDRDKVEAYVREGVRRSPPYIAIAFFCAIGVDFFVLLLRWVLTATTPLPPAMPPKPVAMEIPSRASYGIITERNIFNSDGVIATEFRADRDFDPNKAVPTTLPIDLLGTMVHDDPAMSIAVIKVRSEKIAEVLHRGETLADLADLVGIERGKVFFVNKQSKRMEFAQIPIDKKLPLGEFGTVAPGIVQKEEREFAVDRQTIKQYTSDLGSLLQQARAVPKMGANGQMEGFRIDWIQQGSVFEKLGLKPGDVLRSVNGEKLESPAKAMELYNALRSANNVQLDIDRNGRPESLSFNVN